MKHLLSSLALGIITIAGILGTQVVFADDNGQSFELTVTNLTRGQQFTPILVASHEEGVRLFELGASASPQLDTLAEEGDTGPLKNLLLATPGVEAVVTGSGLTDPGKSVTLTVKTHGEFDHLSVAAMLIPTNDGFFALNDVKGPGGDETLTLFSPAYDVGGEGYWQGFE